MDLRFTAEEIAFRDEVRAFMRDALPAAIRRKMVEGHRLVKDDIVAWQRILNAKGWAVPHWPVEWGGTGWTPVQQYIFRDELHTPAVRANREIGYFGVQHRPALHEFVKPFLRVRVVQQGPVPPMPGALELLIDGGREIHHDTALRERAAIVRLDHRAAAGGQHDGR